MSKIKYIETRFNSENRVKIQQANEIIEEYQKSGLSLTLRQLYYQFVARDLIENSLSSYRKLGAAITRARMAGLVDWSAIEDRTRFLRGINHDINPGYTIEDAAKRFCLNHWDGQDYVVEVWIEKEALIGVISQICNRLDVNFFACKGYVSASETWKAARRLDYYAEQGKEPIIIHLGDHDPSGMDMTRDIQDRCNLFSGEIKIKRIALNMDQIDQYNPPPNYAKESDARFRDYSKLYGDKSWELDALDPKVISELIEGEVKTYRNDETYQNILKLENKYKAVLKNVAKNWETL